MALLGAEHLERNAEHVNALNVFPVPDGDTGTNMNLTMRSGSEALRARPSDSVGKAAEALSKGLLMGARGNSGVILSQLFRGFARGVANLDEVSPVQFAAALQQGVDMAYKSVVKPVEGTILTVAREAAKHAVTIARRTADVPQLMQEVHAKAHEALQRTPDMLPVLKQVGVVDSGGQGLVFIYEGFVESLSGIHVELPVKEAAAPAPAPAAIPQRTASKQPQAGTTAQSRLETESIEFLYDMEFFINRRLGSINAMKFDESWYRRALAKDGDSIIVIADDDIIKVHVHSRKPGDVLNLSLPYGELTDIRILNMREQHRDLLEHEGMSPEEQTDEAGVASGTAGAMPEWAAPEVLTGGVPVQGVPPEEVHEFAPFGIIAVAMGQGISDIFSGNNVDVVLSGGQTMNPSTEDFVQAIHSLSAEHIYLLPNNSNIILTAQQAAELSERSVTVIPTKTIPQGLAALLAFNEDESAESNAERMTKAAGDVQSGQVTLAVRDTVMDGLTIREGHYIGIREKEIVSSSEDLQEACRVLLSSMMKDGGELITLLTGQDAAEQDTNELAIWIEAEFPDAELEVHPGGQPLYPYLIAVE
ncbi:DAK2 domain-containing protein [Paenibacillus tarimensis]|nr:DAK2 domain-containing protein [Paenibacillus tarimensis]MCF2942234.1 DAK2 domain-containing protein [Paenibacillus tarimensis]